MSVKRIVFGAAATFAAILPFSAANAQTMFGNDFSKNNYVQGNLGAVFSGDTHVRGNSGPGFKRDLGNSAGFFGSGLLGHELGDGFAVEGEFVYANADINGRRVAAPGFDDKRSVDTYGGLANLKYMVPHSYAVGHLGVSPYVAAGVGYGGVTYNLGNGDAKDDGLLWQVKTGLDVKVSNRTSLDFGYRYLNGPELGANNDPGFPSAKFSTHQHIASVGARWRF